jgi:triphosphoribosyl-dephospho-CoA synthetase
MTATQILQRLKAGGKTISAVHLYRYFQKFHIRPVGIRQRPQVYPEDAAERILENLGLAPAAPKVTKTTTARAARLPNMADLRRAKLKGK